METCIYRRGGVSRVKVSESESDSADKPWLKFMLNW